MLSRCERGNIFKSLCHTIGVKMVCFLNVYANTLVTLSNQCQYKPNCFYSCSTLFYITLHYITLHYITLHYITLHYITLHYITL